MWYFYLARTFGHKQTHTDVRFAASNLEKMQISCVPQTDS